MAAIKRPRVYLDVNIGSTPAGRLVIELFTDKAPRTCENFRQLCTGEHKGLSYTKSPFHRIIDEFMIQGGDIANGDGTGTLNIYGEEFEDESLAWRDMDAAGLVCSANRGPNTNGSQFFVTLEPTEHLNGKHTIFGRLVNGEDTLRKLARVDVDKNDRPLEPVLIANCGELERRKKAVAAKFREPTLHSRDRGRRRKSNDSDIEMENSPEPGWKHDHRRQSEGTVDEGKRGRVRRRSAARSPSAGGPAMERKQSNGESSSPVKKHKRKRSPSPSRHAEANDDDDHGWRRRRSLPNQYADERSRNRSQQRGRYETSTRREYEQSERDSREGYRASGDDRYRPSRNRGKYGDEGRRDTGFSEEADLVGTEPAVKFKGRGVMKYREPGRL